MVRLYVASSWRNRFQPSVVAAARTSGLEVYDFRNPEPGQHGFSWSEIDPGWRGWSPRQFRKQLGSEHAERGFGLDMRALRECDACVCVYPCGRSAHLELGFAIGAGKKTAVYYPEWSAPSAARSEPNYPSEPELMVKAAGHILCGPLELAEWLSALRESEVA